MSDTSDRRDAGLANPDRAAPESANIAGHLPVMARRRPHALAVASPHGRDRQGRVSYLHCTYRQLDQASDAVASGLRAVGVGPGVRTVLMVKPGLDFFVLTFALFKAGAVMVGIDPGLGVRRLGRCLAEAEPQAFIGIARAHLARTLLGWARPTNRVNVLAGAGHWRLGAMHTLGSLRRRGLQAPTAAPATRPEDPAAVLFTSGSTGPPKGVLYTHANFQAQVRALREVYGIEPGEVDLATFPLFALFAPALGMTAVVPDMDFARPGRADPRKIAGRILTAARECAHRTPRGIVKNSG